MKSKLFTLLSVSLLAACGGSSSDTNEESPPHSESINTAPFAHAGFDQYVDEQTIVYLDASNSNDRDDSFNDLKFNWARQDSNGNQPDDGLDIALSGKNTATPSFTFPDVAVDTKLYFQLTVTDTGGLSSTSRVMIEGAAVNEYGSVTVEAGDNFAAVAGEEVTLKATQYGELPSTGNISYSWNQADSNSHNVSISLVDKYTGKFIAPIVTSDTVLEFTYQIKYSDDVISDSVQVTIKPKTNSNTAPIANAGVDQTVTPSSKVILDGSASEDNEDGKNVTFEWMQIDSSGISVVLDSNIVSQPEFIAPEVIDETILTFELTVTDSENLTSKDIVSVTVKPETGVFLSKLNDTGVTTCANIPPYVVNNDEDHNNKLDCDYIEDSNGFSIPKGQDGHHGRDVVKHDHSDGHAGFSFTKLNNNGLPLDPSATEWACIKDNVTGLIWEAKTNDLGLQDFRNTYSWYSSEGSITSSESDANLGMCDNTTDCDTEKYITRVNNKSLCGANNWRLPSPRELQSIIDYSKYAPSIDVNYFPYTQSVNFWTYSHDPSYTQYFSFADKTVFLKVLFIDFQYGESGSELPNNPLYIRLVRDTK